jgi:hypothetical protein
MSRLNDRAYELLKAEVSRCSQKQAAGNVQRELALKRLMRLQVQSGEPATYAELKQGMDDLFPDFSDRVLRAAARANYPSQVGKSLKRTALVLAGVGGIAGSIWFLNLPFPPIRWVVARTMPVVLLPSFFQMDHNYRQAIANVEQADQLVNRATTAADLNLGKTKVQAAQKNLDALPVWFLGYYPRVYCGWFACGWNYTLDEFQQARKQVARMDAVLFQENQAQVTFTQANQMVNRAKQQYQQTNNSTQRQDAISQWQQGMDQMKELPPTTLAGRMAQPKLMAYQRDFQQVVGLSSDTTRSGQLIAAAKNFATVAQQLAKASALSATAWQEVERQWQMAIDRLNQIPVGDPNYSVAQPLLASYEKALSTTRIRLKQEEEAVRQFNDIQSEIQRFQNLNSINNRNQTTTQLRSIINQLAKIQPGTTVYSEASILLSQAQQRLKK